MTYNQTMVLCPGNMWAIRIKLPNLIFCKKVFNVIFEARQA